MRIVIDLQGAQTKSRFRGIGCYSLSLTKAIIRNRRSHEIFIALSGLFPDTILSLRYELEKLMPRENIRIWTAPGPVREKADGNESRRQIAESMRESFLASLQPDILLVSSLFEGYLDDAVTSIGQLDHNTKTTVILYDLIPFSAPEEYLVQHSQHDWYFRKIDAIKKADLLLTISESSRKDAVYQLGFPENKIINISSATEERFQPGDLSSDRISQLKSRYQITRKMVLYVPGGFDARKNFDNLILAYSRLPKEIRMTHQLVIASKVGDRGRLILQKLSKKSGLKRDEMILTGYVSDDELVDLYRMAALFVFPSKREGFGLPVLEAMACGAPVIGANATSLPEVIGWDPALFDPLDVDDIAAKMTHALTNDEFRDQLCQHGLAQSKRFSWDDSANKSIDSFEKMVKNDEKTFVPSYYALVNRIAKLKIDAPDSDLYLLANSMAQNQNESEYRQLFVDISEIITNDAETGIQRVVRGYLNQLLNNPPAGYAVKLVYGTIKDSYRYAGNVQFIKNYFIDDFSKDKPIVFQKGDIFYALDMQHDVQLTKRQFYIDLRSAGVRVIFHVYDLLPIELAGYFYEDTLKSKHEEWLKMIAMTDGAICISKSTAGAYTQWLSTNNIPLAQGFSIDWVHIGADIESSSSPSKGSPCVDDFLIESINMRPTFLTVGTIEPRKGQILILDAFELLWKEGIDVNLVLVGRPGWKMEPFIKRVHKHQEINKRLFWLNGISDEYLELIYNTSSCLIAASLNEGFGLPLIEAAHHKLPIIARDIPVYREVAVDHAYYFSGHTPVELKLAINNWLKLYQNNRHPLPNGMPFSTWQQSAEKLKRILVSKKTCKQLLVDISELVQRDVQTGIQRVVKSILKEMLINPPQNYVVKAVYSPPGLNSGFFYANQFMIKLFEQLNWYSASKIYVEDEPVDISTGDIFLGLDFHHDVVVRNKVFFNKIKHHGLYIYFIIYDLLPIYFPMFFPVGSDDGLKIWLKSLSPIADGVSCISDETAKHLDEWLRLNGHENHNINIFTTHIGADFYGSVTTKGMPPDSRKILSLIKSSQSFLMVGTLEPRKGHRQVIGAFEALWEKGLDINLVMVGKQGWMVEKLIALIRKHPRFNKNLFWLEGISDEYLEKIYNSSTCLIAASEAEGFGLPLIEAAQHKLPIIARDIAIFREVACDHVYYFPNDRSFNVLANAIQNWLDLYKNGNHPKSENMPWLSWKQSAQQLLNVLIIHRLAV